MSGTGFHLRTPGGIITSHVVLIITGREHGRLNVTRMRNGSFPVLVHFYGFMGSVSISESHRGFSPRLMIASCIAGAGKSVIWYDVFPMVCVHVLKLLASSAIIEDIRSLQRSGLASSHSFTVTSGMTKKRTSVGYSHHCWFSLADSPTPTLFFPISM
jgi:hypothetical protein